MMVAFKAHIGNDSTEFVGLVDDNPSAVTMIKQAKGKVAQTKRARLIAQEITDGVREVPFGWDGTVESLVVVTMLPTVAADVWDISRR